MGERVILDSFQVGALYFINETGVSPMITSINGVPYTAVQNEGYYEKQADGSWDMSREHYEEDPSVVEEFKAWLKAQGCTWHTEGSIIMPDHSCLPNNPARVRGCVYEGDEKATDESNDCKAEEDEPSGETVIVEGQKVHVRHVGIYEWFCGHDISEYADAMKNGFDRFWEVFGMDFDYLIDALDDLRLGGEYLPYGDNEVVPIKEILDKRRLEPLVGPVREGVMAYGNLKMGKEVPAYTLQTLMGAKFDHPTYYALYMYILTGKVIERK